MILENTKTSPHPAAFKVAALYKFVRLNECQNLRQPLLEFCRKHAIYGTLILAREGLNGTVAGRGEAIDALIFHLQNDALFQRQLGDLNVKYSSASEPPFQRMKVRLKSEIVTLRAREADPTARVGTYVEAGDWNDLISGPEYLIIDTRNEYEVELGSFPGALNPKTGSFTEFKDFVGSQLSPGTDKKIAMFCTGGIRCEKASSYLLAHGFHEVFHLKGGILKYLEDVPEEESLWQGSCFVFDERVAVGQGLSETEYSLCHACRMPLSAKDRASPHYREGIECPHCQGQKNEVALRRAEARQQQMELAQSRGGAHLGDQAKQEADRRRQAKREEKKHAQRLSRTLLSSSR